MRISEDITINKIQKCIRRIALSIFTLSKYKYRPENLSVSEFFLNEKRNVKKKNEKKFTINFVCTRSYLGKLYSQITQAMFLSNLD